MFRARPITLPFINLSKPIWRLYISAINKIIKSVIISFSNCYNHKVSLCFPKQLLDNMFYKDCNYLIMIQKREFGSTYHKTTMRFYNTNF